MQFALHLATAESRPDSVPQQGKWFSPFCPAAGRICEGTERLRAHQFDKKVERGTELLRDFFVVPW